MTATLPAATLEMVAAAAGVSRATVSRVVNGSPKVSRDVVAAVTAAIDELRYVPNRAARSLASRQTYAIALLVPEDTTRFFGDPYFASVIKGITARLDESEYVLNLLVASRDPNGKSRRYLRSGSADGALIVSHHSGDRDLAELAATIPVVFGGRPDVADPAAVTYVDVDNLVGARQAAAHLVGLGRRRIGTITGSADMLASVDRLRGWREVLVDAGLPTDAVANGEFTRRGGAAAMRALLAGHPDLDAVFVASDLMGRGALEVLAGAGRRVPEDIALVGYDDSYVATAESPELTTVRQPSERMGFVMADRLLARLAREYVPRGAYLLPTELIRRETG